jgi:hypothetical protein
MAAPLANGIRQGTCMQRRVARSVYGKWMDFFVVSKDCGHVSGFYRNGARSPCRWITYRHFGEWIPRHGRIIGFGSEKDKRFYLDTRLVRYPKKVEKLLEAFAEKALPRSEWGSNDGFNSRELFGRMVGFREGNYFVLAYDEKEAAKVAFEAGLRTISNGTVGHWEDRWKALSFQERPSEREFAKLDDLLGR